LTNTIPKLFKERLENIIALNSTLITIKLLSSSGARL
jgi:hypothetical protein